MASSKRRFGKHLRIYEDLLPTFYSLVPCASLGPKPQPAVLSCNPSQPTLLSLLRSPPARPPWAPAPTNPNADSTNDVYPDSRPSARPKLSKASSSNPNPTSSAPLESYPSGTPTPMVSNFNTRESIPPHVEAPVKATQQVCVTQTPISGGRKRNREIGDSVAVNIQSAGSEQEKKFTLIQDMLASRSHQGFCSDTANLSILLLREYHQKFIDIINSKQFGCQRSSYKHRPLRYPDISFALVPRMYSLTNNGFVFKILHHSGTLIQTHTAMITAHKYLLKVIYTLHEMILNKFEDSTFVHHSQQRKLLKWLDGEIFKHTCGPPLVGLRLTETADWGNDVIGESKLKLIHYFSFDEIDKPLAASTAYDLIQIFIAQDKGKLYLSVLEILSFQLGRLLIEKNPTLLSVLKQIEMCDISFENQRVDYSLPSGPLENSNQIPVSPEFEERVWKLLKMTEQMIIKYEALLAKQYRHVGDDAVLRASVKRFGRKLKQPDMRNFFKTVHSRLPSSLYFIPGKTPGSPGQGHLRVIGQDDRTTVTLAALSLSFKRLLKGISYLHIEVHRRLAIPEELYDERRKALYNWLIALVLNPVKTLPIIGTIPLLHKDLAPWEDVSYRGVELFNPTQLNMIEYFSKEQSGSLIREHAAFLLTAWYHDHHSTEFPHLNSCSLPEPVPSSPGMDLFLGQGLEN
ncbi:hypothetical protein Pst134EA_028874 [Puccinia striiformis f. sp. tritici]|uniref:hypothetical protein n=1 Tax=Puccinia striiformis f. sp. tritici TaxID=168172 RepID=UPI00200798BA|nr:hypothetical protein Pst134EA_028874 [Puccinia striiformis f. sp. tritici]KAH9446887.1 hypothetical protein Pst134EA_028874 [Puccinia striiformis f. sp. tritici]